MNSINSKIKLEKLNEKVYLFGKKFQLIDINYQKKENFKLFNNFYNTIWITYRKNFPPLIKENYGGIILFNFFILMFL